MYNPPTYNPPKNATLEERKEHFMLQYVIARAYHMKDFTPVGAVIKAEEAWNEIQYRKHR